MSHPSDPYPDYTVRDETQTIVGAPLPIGNGTGFYSNLCSDGITFRIPFYLDSGTEVIAYFKGTNADAERRALAMLHEAYIHGGNVKANGTLSPDGLEFHVLIIDHEVPRHRIPCH